MTSRFHRLLNPALVWTAVLLVGSVALAALAQGTGTGPAAAAQRGVTPILCPVTPPLAPAPPRVGQQANATTTGTAAPTDQRPNHTDAAR